jgi:hypothetical protein
MALIHISLLFLAICGFSFAVASLGSLILRSLHIEMDSDAQHLLVCMGLGVLSVEVLIFGVEVTQQIRRGCFVVLGLLCIFILAEFRTTSKRCVTAWKKLLFTSRTEPILFAVIGIALVIEFLTCLAPLTGSDALHYHFTAQKLILENGFHPNFSITNSFLCGQQHLLILFGLALGSERLAMGLIYLGGVLAAFSLGCLTALWTSSKTAITVSLLFILTPVVFWQISASGAPDIWMGFLATAAVIVLCQKKARGMWQQAFLAGLLAGGIAGTKYIGCIIAAALAVAMAVEYRSALRALMLCAASLLTGFWPYLRNFVWTGDPVFPLLTKSLFPERVNPMVMKDFLAETGASETGHFGRLLPFVFFAEMRKSSLGFWDFFGPIIFALAPLLLFAAFRDFRKWRIPAMVWCFSAVGIFCVSGLPRFLLAVFPLALCCIAVAIDFSEEKGWRVANKFAVTLIVLLSIVGAAGLLMYSWKPMITALRIVREDTYLEQRAPEYQQVEAINQALGPYARKGKTMLFLRHIYYLRVPFLNGNPSTSWTINPNRFRTSEDWRNFFRENKIAFVVRSPDYPDSIRPSLMEMEAKGYLAPVAESVVQDFQGMRIQGQRKEIPVTILEVKDSVGTQGSSNK